MMEHVISVRPGFGGFDELYEKARVVFLGVPIDVTASYRPGTRFGPAKIRGVSANLETYLMSANLDVFERLGISDLGDIIVVPTDLTQTGDRIRKVLAELREDEEDTRPAWGRAHPDIFRHEGFQGCLFDSARRPP